MVEVGTTDLTVGGAVPDVFDRAGAQVAQHLAAVEIGAAQRNPAVPEDREREPRPVAGEADVRFLVQRPGPVVQVGDMNLVGLLPPVGDERLFLRRVVLAEKCEAAA